MTTETLRVTEPRDLLATVPFLLGFEPSRSLVALSLRGDRRRVGVVARVDLPPPGPACHEVAERLAAHLRHDGARETVLVVYQEREAAAPPTPTHVTDVVDAVTDALADAGIGLLDAWLVSEGRYRSLLCAGGCCPAEGRPVDELRSSRLAAELTWRGAAVAGSRESVIAGLEPAPPERLAAVEAFAVRQTVPPRGEDGRERRAHWARRALAAWWAEVERARRRAGLDADDRDAPAGLPASPYEAPPASAGRLLAALGDVAGRDAVMLACVPGSGGEPRRVAALGTATARAEELFDRVFSPLAAIQPPRADVEAASLVLASLVRQASGPRQVPALALLAWLAWWRGDGGAAGQYLDLALDLDPTYRLAVLLRASLDRGVAPGWVGRQRLEDETAGGASSSGY